MNTINISLPSQLKAQADQLIEQGYFVSFSDLVRTAMRKLVNESQLDLWSEEAKYQLKTGKARVLTGKNDITSYLEESVTS